MRTSATEPPPVEAAAKAKAALVRASVIFAFTIEVAFAATATVANTNDEAGVAGATGLDAAVPATTCNRQSLLDPAYAASRTVNTTLSIRGRVALAVPITNVTAASLYVEYMP